MFEIVKSCISCFTSAIVVDGIHVLLLYVVASSHGHVQTAETLRSHMISHVHCQGRRLCSLPGMYKLTINY